MARKKINPHQEIDKVMMAFDKRFLAKDQNNLIEKDKDDKGREFTMIVPIIPEPDIEHVLLRFNAKDDKFFPYFNHGLDLHKSCDYVLIAETASDLYIFLIELKNKDGQPKRQTVITRNFMKFVISHMECCLDYSSHITKNLEYRLIGVKSSISKKETVRSYMKPYDADGYLAISAGAQFHLRKYLSLPCN